MYLSQDEQAPSINEWAQACFRSLYPAQVLILAPGNAMELKPEEIRLERGTVTELDPAHMQVLVKTEAGREWMVAVDRCDPDRLYLGGVGYDRGLGYRYWVFLSEQDFWMWREWYILTTLLNQYVAFTGCDVEELANERNLQIARIFYDVLVNGNLGPSRTVTFPPLTPED